MDSVTAGAVTVTLKEHVAVCGVASLFVARSVTVKGPPRSDASPFRVAVAEPPGVEAGDRDEIENAPAPLAGVTESTAIDVTVPSASVAETGRENAVP
jgi:hypothetical protein